MSQPAGVQVIWSVLTNRQIQGPSFPFWIASTVGGFSVMDNHLHVLVRLDPDVAMGWSDEEVVRRWGHLFPPRDKSRQPLPVTKAWVDWRLKDLAWIATARTRLQSLSWPVGSAWLCAPAGP